jgi:type IV secretory pathway VirB10-like protein
MPLSSKSIIDPGEVASRAPLKKSTVAWAVVGVVMLAVAGVFAPRLLSDTQREPTPKRDKPVNTGLARTIDGEFEDSQRRIRFASPPASAMAPVVAPPAPAIAPLPQGAPAAPPVPVVPPDVRRDSNAAALYGRRTEGLDGTGTGVEMEAAARNSASVKHDFGEQPAAGASQPAADPMLTRLRSLVPEPSVAPGSAAAPSDRLTALLEAQQRRPEQPVSARAGDRAWLKEWSDAPRPTPLRPYVVAHPYTLLQGKVLPAVLGKDLNTDLPGEVTAYTTQDVYDSLSSRYLLVPKGSMLSGKYSNAVRTGQQRILFAFTRITLPNGASVDLPGFGGADPGGAAGIEGDVNNHFFRQFASSVLVALLASKVEGNQSRPTIVGGSYQGGAVSAAGQVLVDVSRSILERNKSIEPTITVAKGTQVLVEVTRDIEFAGAYRSL